MAAVWEPQAVWGRQEWPRKIYLPWIKIACLPSLLVHRPC